MAGLGDAFSLTVFGFRATNRAHLLAPACPVIRCFDWVICLDSARAVVLAGASQRRCCLAAALLYWKMVFIMKRKEWRPHTQAYCSS